MKFFIYTFFYLSIILTTATGMALFEKDVQEMTSYPKSILVAMFVVSLVVCIYNSYVVNKLKAQKAK